MRRDLAGRQQVLDADRDPDSGGTHAGSSATAVRSKWIRLTICCWIASTCSRSGRQRRPSDIVDGARRDTVASAPARIDRRPERRVCGATGRADAGIRLSLLAKWKPPLFSPDNFNPRDADIFHGETPLQRCWRFQKRSKPPRHARQLLRGGPSNGSATRRLRVTKNKYYPASAASGAIGSVESGAFQWLRKLFR